MEEMVEKAPFGRRLSDFNLDDGTGGEARLHPAEAQLLEAVRKGETCIIAEARPADETADNIVRAAFVRFLALGGDGAAPVHERGVRLQGAFVQGALDLQACENLHALYLVDCLFSDKLILLDAELKILNLGGSSITGLIGDRVRIQNDLFMRRGFQSQKEVRLLGADIGGNLDCQGGAFQNPDGYALLCDRVRIGGNAFLVNGFEAASGLRFTSATIGGDVVCSGGVFRNPGGIAIDLQKAKIGGVFFLEADGRSPEFQTLIEGHLDLTGASISGLGDEKQAWPPVEVEKKDGDTVQCYIYLNGLSFDRFGSSATISIADRKRWLQRQPSKYLCEDFKPQPFEQLARVYRNMGHDDDAREIMEWKQRHMMRRPVQGFGRTWPWQASLFRLLRWAFYEKLAGHGFLLHRPLLIAFAIWFGFGLLFSFAEQSGAIAPTNPILYLNAEMNALCEDRWTACDHPKMQAEHTPFYAWAYSLDVLLPIVPLGQDTAWAPVDAPEWRIRAPFTDLYVPILLWGYWVETLYGWLVGLLLVAVITGALNRQE